ncbi:MAG: undecaprenyl-phosphate galactose phosphotransferase WbaP [Alphaproteobacteria bacterium]
MLLTDLVALELCVFFATLVRIALDPIWPITINTGQYWDISVGVLGLPIAFQLMGFYPGYGVCPVMRLRQRVITTFILFSVLIIWAYLQQHDGISRGILMFSMAFAMALPWLMEVVVREILIKSGMWGQSAVVVGAGDGAAEVIKSMRGRPELGFNPVAVLDDDRETWGRTYHGVDVLGGLDQARDFADAGVKTAVLVKTDLDGKAAAKMVQSLNFENVIVIPNLFGLQSVWVTPIDFQSVVGLRVRNNLLVRHNYVIKRFVDYLVTLPATLVALPIIGIAAIWIKLVDGGPVFFQQRRRGYANRSINVLKLRTMYKDADRRLEEHLTADPEAKAEWEAFFKLKNDPRILPGVGHFLRKTSLDELPQLLNILRGEMTLVGPRPFPEYHLECFDESFRELRASVPPGLTGLWQVSARSDGDTAVQERLDTDYIRNWSLWLDFYILLRTVVIVVRGSGAY